MAGTLIKQEVFGSSELRALAKAMSWSEREALGCLGMLWNGSQNAKVTRAPRELIAEWCRVDAEEERDKLVDALASRKCRYIKRTRLLTFVIVGNRKQVTKLKQLSALRNAGGKSTRAKFQRETSDSGQKTSKSEKQNHESIHKLDAEVKLDPIPFPSLPCPSIPFHSPPFPSTQTQEHDPSQESFALLGSGAGKSEDFENPMVQAIVKLDREGKFDETQFSHFAGIFGEGRIKKILELGRAALSGGMEFQHV